MLTALTLVSNTVLHRFTSPFPPHCAVPQLQSPLTAPSTLTCCGMTVHLLLSTGIICRLLHFLNILLYSSQCRISLSRNFCLTCSLNVRGFAGHHSTRFSCPLLKYYPENVCHLQLNFVLKITFMMSLKNINLCNVSQIFKCRDACMQLLFTISLNMTAYHIPLTAVLFRSAVKEILFIMPALAHSVCHR